MTGTTSPAGVVVVGSLTVDLTSFSDRLPAPGETVLGSGFTQVAGGKGANQALAAAAMNADTWMVGCVGDDGFRDTVMGTLAAAGVNAEHVRVVPGVSTGIAHIRVDGRGDNDIVIVPQANASLSCSDVDEALSALQGQVGVLLSQLEIDPEVAGHALREGRRRGLLTVLDPAPAPRHPLPDDLLGHIDVLTPNETEASLLTGVDVVDTDSAETAGRWLVDRGCGCVVVTLGAAGAVVVRPGQPTRVVSASRVEPVDATAAGDAFTGAMGARLAAGDGLDDALAWAAAAGALATTERGASTSIPRFDSVQRLLSGTGELITSDERF